MCQVQRQEFRGPRKQERRGPYKKSALSQSLCPGLRTYVSATRDAGGTGGRQTQSLAVKCPRRISAVPAGGAAGVPGWPEDLGPCQLLEGGRASYEAERKCSPGLGGPTAARIPAGALGPAWTLLDLASPFPFLEAKAITTNFESHAEAGLTLELHKGDASSRHSKRGSSVFRGQPQPMAKSQSHAL